MLGTMPASPDRAIRAVFFDAGNTLLRIDYAAIARELARHGRTVPLEAIQHADWLARVRLDAELSGGGPGPRSTENASTAGRYFGYALEALGITEAATREALDAWRRAYNQPVGFWNVADPDAEPALALAREAGLATAVISNSNGSVRSILDALGLTRHLDFVIDSFEVGVEKPDPRIFRLALTTMGVGAAEAVHVGDLYSIDVLGARAAGLDAILLDPGRCWGERDCTAAPSVLAAVRLVLNGGVRRRAT
jgi:putative hydrolase of the HAD superfamily